MILEVHASLACLFGCFGSGYDCRPYNRVDPITRPASLYVLEVVVGS